MRLHPRTSSGAQSDSGYILLVLMLWVAVLSITVSMPMIYYYRQQMIRDREEELVHRGVEYERAVRKYYRKFGSYPASLDLLESANHMRFLRKRYKDPISGQDFRPLTYADVMTSFAAAIPGGTIPGGQSLGTPVSDIASGSAPVIASTQGQPAPSPPATAAPDANAAPDPSAAGSASDSTPAPATNSTLPFGAKPTPSNNGPTFGGGGIVGVASVSKAESIRVFNKKNHYNEWLFAYNPQTDRGGLPKGPYEPTLPVLPGQLGLPGQQLNGQGAAVQPGFGQQGFGQQGFGQQGLGGMGGNSFGSHR
jgi:type II secretory pathway pseudopilin PulG